MKKIIMFLLVTVLFLPVGVFARSETVLTEEEYDSVVVDPAVDEIVLGADIELTERHETIINDCDRTLDLNGYVLSNDGDSTQNITFEVGDRSLLVIDSVGTGKIISKYNFQTINNTFNDNTIVFKNLDYESIRGSGVFILNGGSKAPLFVIDNVFFYYHNNSPLSESTDLDIRYMKVLPKEQNNPVGFYNDDDTRYLSDILVDDNEIYRCGDLDEHQWNTTKARDIYFLETTPNREKGIVVRLKNKRLIEFDYNGIPAKKSSRKVVNKDSQFELNEELLEKVENPINKRFDKFLVNDEEKELGDTITISDDTTIKYLWETLSYEDIYKAELEDIDLGEIQMGYEPDDYISIFRITNNSIDVINRTTEYYKIELTDGRKDAFDIWVNNAGYLNPENTYNAGSVKPAAGLHAGKYKATVTLYYDPDGEGTEEDWMALDSREFSVTITPDPNADLSFKDVPKSAWYYDSVKEAYNRGIIAGYGPDRFGPNDKVTRGQLVTFLYRIEGEPAVSGTSKFSDVKEGEYYTDPVKWASNNHIVNGYGNTGTFGPTKPIIRQDLAVILNNYAKFKGYPYEEEFDLSGFADYNAVKGGYAEPALKWAVKNHVMSGAGLPNGKRAIQPTNNTTRAQAAAMIVNFLDEFSS